MKKNMLAFLFGESQVSAEIEEAKDCLDEILEAAEKEEPLNAKKTPLAAALKAAGLSGEGLELGPEGFSLSFDNEEDFKAAVDAVIEPIGMEALAKNGWVAAIQGDKAMSGEVKPEYRIRFIDITTPEPEDSESWPAPNPKLMADIIKKGREFATLPFPRDPENPVTDMAAPNKKKAGMGKESDGGKPASVKEAKKTCRIKDCEGQVVADAREKHGPGFQGLCASHIESQKEREAKTGRHSQTIRRIHGHESLQLVNKLVGEGRHKPGCQCGFCKNMGRGFGKKQETPAADASQENPPEE